MALTILVTKKGVTQMQEGLWNITLNLVCKDSTIEVINQDFTMRYKTGQDIEIIAKGIQEEMQRVITRYKSSQVIFNHTKLNNAVAYLNSNLVG
jgi:hypothetical protein